MEFPSGAGKDGHRVLLQMYLNATDDPYSQQLLCILCA